MNGRIEATRTRTCHECGVAYTPSEELGVEWLGSHTENYDLGVRRYCRACWLGVGPNDRPAILEDVTDPRSGSAAPTYESEDARSYIHQSTGLSVAVVDLVLRSAERYLEGLGIVSGGEADVEQLRHRYLNLFPEENRVRRLVCHELELQFIEVETGLDVTAITTVLAADLKYMANQGIVSPSAPAAYAYWAGLQRTSA